MRRPVRMPKQKLLVCGALIWKERIKKSPLTTSATKKPATPMRNCIWTAKRTVCTTMAWKSTMTPIRWPAPMEILPGASRDELLTVAQITVDLRAACKEVSMNETTKKARGVSAPKPSLNPLTQQDRFAMIAEAAYFAAQCRGFEPGHELESGRA